MPHTLLSQPSHSPEKEQIPARKHRGIGQGQGAAPFSACSSPHSSGAASTVSPQVSPRGHPCYIPLVFS